MILTLTAVALVVVAVLAAFWKRRIAEPHDGQDLDAALDRETRQFVERLGGPGLVIGAFKQGRTVIKGYGTVDAPGGAQPDADTIFQIGSVTKIFTASLLQVLCDEGVVALDDSLEALIGTTFPLAPAVRAVTLRQLVSHTSGFPGIPKPLENRARAAIGSAPILLDPYSHLGPEQIFDYLATAEGKKPPGRFDYSNFGMGLLAHVLEVVTMSDFESLIRQKVLLPLGMTATGVTMTAAHVAQLAQGHTAKRKPTPIWTFRSLAGAGALHSSAQDMVAFIGAQVEADSPLAASFRAMREPQTGGKTGIGWILPALSDRLLGNRRIVWHNGMVGGYAAYLGVAADDRLGIIVLINRAVDVALLGTKLLQLIRTQSWRP